MEATRLLPLLLGTAWLLPLASFAVIVFFGPRMGKGGRGAGYVATLAIAVGFVLSATALGIYYTPIFFVQITRLFTRRKKETQAAPAERPCS